MSISITWSDHIIHIPQSYLNLVSGTIYQLDTEQFRLDLKALEASVYGMPNLKTHDHNTVVTVAGTTYARSITILPPYSVEFENNQYTVILVGSNNNIFDVANGILVQNQVQIIPTNAAGLIVHNVGSGVTAQDKLDIADAVWNETTAEHTTANTFGKEVAQKDDLSGITVSGITINNAAIADAVWEESISEHIVTGTFGNEIAKVSDLSAIVDTNAIATAIWSSLTNDYLISGTMGYDIAKKIDLDFPSLSLTEAGIAAAVWNSQVADYTVSGIFGSELIGGIDYVAAKVDINNTILQFISDLESGRQVLIGNQLICYKPDNITELIRFNLYDSTGSPTIDNVYRRDRV